MSRKVGWPWNQLDLDGETDTKEVRRAYAKKLKTIDQATDIQGFTDLRTAYDMAMRIAQAKANTTQAKTQPPRVVQVVPLENLDEAFVPAKTPVAAPKPVDTAKPDVVTVTPDHEPAKPPKPPPETVHVDASNQSAKAEPTDAQRRAADLREMLDQLATETPWSGAGDRMRQALHHPMAKDPETAGAVRRAVRNELIKAYGDNNGNWPASVTSELLDELDAAYGWLTDYKASQQDFFGQQELLHDMYQQKFGYAAMNQATQRHEFRYQKRKSNGVFLARMLQISGLIIVYVAVGRLLGAILPEVLKYTAGILLLIAMITLGYLSWTRLTPRMAPKLAEWTNKLLDSNSNLRDQFKRFAMPVEYRVITTSAWISAAIVLRILAIATEDSLYLRLAGWTLFAGVAFSLAQAWLNAGRARVV